MFPPLIPTAGTMFCAAKGIKTFSVCVCGGGGQGVEAIHLMCFIDFTAHLLHGFKIPRVCSLEGKSKSLMASLRKFRIKWKYDYEAIS